MQENDNGKISESIKDSLSEDYSIVFILIG